MILTDYLRFFIFCILTVIPAGLLILKLINFKGNFWEHLLIGINIGFIFTTFTIYLSDILKLNNFSYILIFLPFFSLCFLKLGIFNRNLIKESLRIDYILVFIIILVISLQGYLNFFSGEISSEGIRLVAGHAHDSLWHLSLINNLKVQIPPENPIYSGFVLTNYHYFSDIFMAMASKFTNITVTIVYFKIMGPFLLLLFCGTIYALILMMTENKVLSYMAVLLTALSSNLYYLTPIFYKNATITPSVFWVDEFTTRMTNLQLLASYVVILTILYLLLNFREKLNIKVILVLSITISSILGFKVYGFILILLSLLVLLIYRRTFNYLKLVASSIFFSFLIYREATSANNFPFTPMPFWFIKNMFETNDHLNYSIWELKRQTYLQDNNYFRIGTLYIEGIIVFLLGNLGGKIVGFLTIFQKYQKDKIDIIIILTSISIFGILIPFVFLQKGIVWNTIQFFYYSYLSLSLLFILFISGIWLRSKSLSVIIFATVWLTLLPGIFYTLNLYSPNKSSIQYKSALINAAHFLKGKEKGIVLLDPLYYDDALVSALSEQSVFLADATQLFLLSINLEEREKDLKHFFENEPRQKKFDFLRNSRVKYIIANKNRIFLEEMKDLKKIYSNLEVNIYETRF